jgi:hypothetical protein
VLLNFRTAAAEHNWSAVVVSPVLAVRGPWNPADLITFIETHVVKRYAPLSSQSPPSPSSPLPSSSSSSSSSHLSTSSDGDDGISGGSGDSNHLPPFFLLKRLYLVGSSVGGVGVLRLLQHCATTKPYSLLGLFAAAAVVSPGCGAVAGPEFSEDLYCVMPKKRVDRRTMQVVRFGWLVRSVG